MEVGEGFIILLVRYNHHMDIVYKADPNGIYSDLGKRYSCKGVEDDKAKKAAIADGWAATLKDAFKPKRAFKK